MTYTVKGVEILASGSYKNGAVKLDDEILDNIISAYTETNIMPPIKDGHHKEIVGYPALGWVTNLKRVGSKLVADFIDLPEIVYNAIKDHRYDRVSSELAMNFKLNDKVIPHVLRAVALLGAELPEIKSLKPIRESLSVNDKLDVVLLDDVQACEFESCECLALDMSITLQPDKIEASLIEAAESISTDALRSSVSDSVLSNVTALTEDSEGVQLIVGRIRATDDMAIQSILFDKKTFTEQQAIDWLNEHKMKASLTDATENKLRFRQRDSSEFESSGFKLIESEQTNNRKEDKDMSKTTDERMAEMEAGLKTVEVSIKAKDEEIEKKNSEITSLSEKLKATEVKLSEIADTKDGKKLTEMQKQLDGLKDSNAKAIEQMSETNKKNETLLEDQRQDRIARKADGCKLPAFRQNIKLFYDLATNKDNSEKTVELVEGDQKKQIKFEDIVDSMVSTINKLSENSVFTEKSQDPDYKMDEHAPSADASEEVDRRTTALLTDKGWESDKYSDAMAIVLDSDAGLKDRYHKEATLN